MASTSPEPKVLVVDDHHDGAETLGEFLRLLGCQVRLAYSGEEALDVAPKFAPDLVILDIEMPGLNGLETARRLRTQTWARQSILATHSGSQDPAIADLSRQAGCERHLRKPASDRTFEDIIAAIRQDRCRK
jgi:CheY-like chemotaxis protein